MRRPAARQSRARRYPRPSRTSMQCPSEELFSASRRGELSSDDELELARHVQGCGRCATVPSTLAQRDTTWSHDDGDDEGHDALAAGTVVGRFVIEGKVGQGG